MNKPYQPGRQSNINKNYLERLENSEEISSMVTDHKTGKGSMFVNERSEINTSRDFNKVDNNAFVRPIGG